MMSPADRNPASRPRRALSRPPAGPASARRSLAVGAFAAVLLVGCGAVPTPTSPTAAASPTTASLRPQASPTGYVVPWIDGTPTPVPSPTPVVIPAGTATCPPGDLTATAGWQGATGSMAGGIAVTNVSRHACVLSGAPRLVRLRSGTAILSPVTYTAERYSDPGDPSTAAAPVLLQPGDQASAFVVWMNLCSVMRPVVTALLVTLSDGGDPIVATSASPGRGIFGAPRCDQPGAGSTFTAYAFAPVPPPEPPYEPQAASVVLSAPPTTTVGADLAFLVTLTNVGSKPASLIPCPTFTEDLIVDGRALKPPAPQQFLLNCSAIGDALAPGATVTMEMKYAMPPTVTPGPVELVWSLDPGGPFDGSTAIQRVALTLVGG